MPFSSGGDDTDQFQDVGSNGRSIGMRPRTANSRHTAKLRFGGCNRDWQGYRDERHDWEAALKTAIEALSLPFLTGNGWTVFGKRESA